MGGREIVYRASDNRFLLTERQYDLWKYAIEKFRKESCPPTIRDYAADFGITPAAVFKILDILAVKGAMKPTFGPQVGRNSRKGIPVTHDGSCLLCGKKNCTSVDY